MILQLSWSFSFNKPTLSGSSLAMTVLATLIVIRMAECVRKLHAYHCRVGVAPSVGPWDG